MNMWKRAVSLWRERAERGATLQRRLILFFLFAAVFLIALFVLLLLLFGITGSGQQAAHAFVSGELTHISYDVYQDFGKLAVRGVALAEGISEDAARLLPNGDGTIFQADPGAIDDFLAAEIHPLLSILDSSGCSGAFLVLDATVNPRAQNAEHSRAGLFLKRTEPNTVSTAGSDLHFLRGPARIARENGIELLGQWQMEFDVTDFELFGEVMDTARENPDLALSRLYFWSGRVTLKNNSESGFLLCVPLRDKNGAVFGLCGVEVSDRLFKRLYSPDNGDYPDIFAALAPVRAGRIEMQDGMIAGNYYLTSARRDGAYTILSDWKGFALYGPDEVQSAGDFAGLHTRVTLYPADSPYAGQDWLVAVMMDAGALRRAVSGSSRYLIVIAAILVLASFGVACFISRRYLRPVTEGLNAIRAENYAGAGRSPVVEINDLMEFLAQRDKALRAATDTKTEAELTPMFEEFLKNVKTLSPAERSVFELYLEGCSAQEIAARLYLSINTIKTHNRRIFAKLNVSTRKELLVYLDMMRELGRIDEI